MVVAKTKKMPKSCEERVIQYLFEQKARQVLNQACETEHSTIIKVLKLTRYTSECQKSINTKHASQINIQYQPVSHLILVLLATCNLNY